MRVEIPIATAGPFTGQNIFRGEQIQHGAEMAVAHINARGGILGERVELTLACRGVTEQFLGFVE